MTTARQVREKLLAHGEEILNQSIKLGLHGDPDYTGDGKMLAQLVKMVSPLMSLSDDKTKLIPSDKTEYHDAILDKVMSGEMEPGFAKELLTILQQAQNVGELNALISRLDAIDR